jgi:hypothetical protein
LLEYPVFIGVLGHPSFGGWHTKGSCEHMPRPNGPSVLRQPCGPFVVIGLSGSQGFISG